MFKFILCASFLIKSFSQTYVLKNKNFYFGNQNENSVNSYGQLCQPWYLSHITNTWYKLTYASYPLDFAIGFDNQINYVYDFSPSYSNDNYSLVQIQQNNSNILQGFGTIVSDRIFFNFFIRNQYSLAQNDTFIRVDSLIKPLLSYSNVRIFFGTRDDFVGTSDVNIKTRGNILNGNFVPTNNASSVIEVTNNVEGVLFYSTFLNTDAIFSSCCSFSNVYNANPAILPSSTITATDGSYGLVLYLGNVTANTSYFYTWYYSAGVLSQLTNITTQISNDVILNVSPSPTCTMSIILKNNMSNITLSATSSPLFIITPYPTTSPSPSGNASTFIINNLADTSTATILGGTAVGLAAVATGLLAAYHIKIPQNVTDKLNTLYKLLHPILRRFGIDPVKMIQDKIGIQIVKNDDNEDKNDEKNDDIEKQEKTEENENANIANNSNTNTNANTNANANANNANTNVVLDKFKDLLARKFSVSEPVKNNNKNEKNNAETN